MEDNWMIFQILMNRTIVATNLPFLEHKHLSEFDMLIILELKVWSSEIL